MNGGPLKDQFRAWLQLVRAPNLLTAPGDPVAGFLMAAPGGGVHPGGLAAVAGAALCFYTAGLLLNDVADFAEDRRERPARPLPSGRVSRPAALVVAVLLLSAGAALCAGLGPLPSRIGLALMAAIVLYDLGVKRWPVLGPLLMGACRALSLLLGAAFHYGSLYFAPNILAAAATLGLYIAAVTQLARHETRPERAGKSRSLPAGILIAGMIVFLAFSPPLRATPWLAFVGLFGAAVLLCLVVAFQLIMRPRRLPPELPPEWAEKEARNIFPGAVGLLISNLLFIQAGFCAGSGHGAGVAAALCLSLLWPLNRMLGRQFYAS